MLSTFEQSLDKLCLERVDALLAHHAPDILVEGGHRLIAGMEQLKELGRVSKIGVSVYDGDQLESLLREFTPDLVQLPLNVFDQRLIHSGWLQRLHEKGVEIHARSVFLQGLLLMPLTNIPTFFDPVRPLLECWHAAASAQGLSLVQAALAFVRDLSEVDHLLIGVESLMQFQSCLDDFSFPAKFDATGLACDNASFVNPSLWKI